MNGSGGLDWNMVGALAASIAAIGAVIAVWWQNRQARFNTGLQVFWELERHFFHDPEMVKQRKKAAQAILNWDANTEPQKSNASLRRICDFFEFAGLLLRRGAIDREFAWSSFHLAALTYWETANGLIKDEQNEDPYKWIDFAFLADALKREDKRQTQRHKIRPTKRDETYWMKRLREESGLGIPAPASPPPATSNAPAAECEEAL